MEKNKKYELLRENAMNVRPRDLGIVMTNEEDVYAILLDFKGVSESGSLFIGGSRMIDLYFENHDPIVGLGEEDEIAKAGFHFLRSLKNENVSFSEVDTSDFDEKRMYILTKDETYMIKINKDTEDENIRHISSELERFLKVLRDSYLVDSNLIKGL